MSDTIDWPHELSSLSDMALEEIMPAWQADGPHPTRDWPTYKWLCENGFSHLKWILETKHDMTLSSFFGFCLGMNDSEV